VKRIRPRSATIKIDIYDYDILVFFHPDILEYEKFLRKNGPADYRLPERYLSARGLFSFRKDGPSAIWLPGYPKTPDEIAALAHECTHAAMHCLEHVGVPTNGETDEALACVVGFLVKEILKKLK
jgi:hypothetical protein